MPARLSAKPDFLPSPRLLLALGGGTSPVEQLKLRAKLQDRKHLIKLQKQARQDRAELTKETEWLAQHFDQPPPDDFQTDELAQCAVEAKDKTRTTAEQFAPVIEALNRLLASDDALEPEIQQLVREGLDLLEGWLGFYSGLQEMLARQVAERRPAGEPLRARPVTGDVDHAALSREFMARFPRIRAALAK
jgi:hypothetical protein